MLSADLSGAFTGLLPTELPFGGTSQIDVRLTNTGNTRAAEPVDVQLFASTTPTPHAGDLPLASRQENLRLNPKQAANVKLDVPSPITLPTGEYDLIAEVNGSVVTAAPVQIQAPFSDLAVTFAGLPAKPVEIDGYSSGTRVASVDVTNTGNVRLGGKVDVSLYLSADGALDSTASLLATANNTTISLKPGGSKAVVFRIAVPPGTTDGGYFLIAKLTPGVALTDTNTANNVAVSSRRIAVVTQLPHPTTVNKTVNVYLTTTGGGGYDTTDDGSTVCVSDGGDAVASPGDDTGDSSDVSDSSADYSSTDDSSDDGNMSDDSSGGDF